MRLLTMKLLTCIVTYNRLEYTKKALSRIGVRPRTPTSLL
jgi:hypothetical protein